MYVTLISYVVITLILSSSAFFFFPDIATEERGAHVLLASSIAINIFQVGAVWFLLTSLHVFKGKLKASYYMLASGILIYALSFLSTIFTALGITPGQIIQAALVILPYAFSSVLIFLGMRRFARILQIREIWGSFWFAVACSLVLSFLASLIPHSPIEGVDEKTFDTVMGLLAWGAGLTTVATVLAVHIRQRLGKYYQRPMLLLAVALGILAFVSLHELAVESNDLVNDYAPAYFTYSLWPPLLASFMLLWAGISFKAVSKQLGVLASDASYIDVVTYTAQLASNPTEIDLALDKVRSLTASKEGELTPADIQTLLGVYRDIETYLTTKEPVLKITQEELRARLPEFFQRDLARYLERN